MGLYQYAEALYNLGQFEKALIAYHRGYRLRKDMDGFRIGVQKSQEAIQKAIGGIWLACAKNSSFLASHA